MPGMDCRDQSTQPLRYSRCTSALADLELRTLPLSVSYSTGPSTRVARFTSCISSVSGPPISKPEKVLPLPLQASTHSRWWLLEAGNVCGGPALMLWNLSLGNKTNRVFQGQSE